ncbi:MAG TPA: HEPN domain-containing protein [Dehalococcoidia bacterium]|nr:HEPN domain-containing protein [Dehalococcoidia bacterium]
MRPASTAAAASGAATPATLAEIVGCLVEALRPERVYLFGSQARGDAGPESDYDLMLVVSAPEESLLDLTREAYRVLRACVARPRPPIDALVWSRERFDRQSRVIASLPATILREGRLLYPASARLREATWELADEDEKLRLAHEWLRKAEHDIRTAEYASHIPDLTDIVAFHAQQAVEKALKAFLIWHDQPFRKTHDLAELVSLC